MALVLVSGLFIFNTGGTAARPLACVDQRGVDKSVRTLRPARVPSTAATASSVRRETRPAKPRVEHRASRSTPRAVPVPPLVPRTQLEKIAIAAAKKYGIDARKFFRVIKCESGWNPRNVNPGSSGGCEGWGCYGLTQQHGRYWTARAKGAGFPGASWFDPKANLYVGARLAASRWSHYDCA